MARYKQLTVGELEGLLLLIKNKDIKVCIGFGESTLPLCFTLNDNGKLLLHPTVYYGNQKDNLKEVLSLNTES